MGEIGTLWITLGAKTQGLQQGLAQTKKGLKETAKETGTVTAGLKTFAKEVFSVTAILGTLRAAYQLTITDTMDYAKNVRDLQRDIGGSAQEISGLIQAGDDVMISFETMQTAMRAAVRLGVKPTVENLGVLADQYLALAPGVERTAFLMKNFGRAGAEMGALMELGSEGIKKAAAEAADFGLILDDVMVKQARELEKGWDNIQDAWKGIGIQVGTVLIPVLTSATGAIVNMVGQEGKQKRLMSEHHVEIKKQAISWSEWADELMRSANAAGQLKNGEYELFQQMKAIGEYDPSYLQEWSAQFGFITEAAWNLKLAGLDPVINSGDALKQELMSGKQAGDGYYSALTNLVGAMDAVNGKHMKTFLDVEVIIDTVYGPIQSMMSDPRSQDPRLWRQQQGLYGKGAIFKKQSDTFDPDKPGGASGGSFVVPAGYLGDSYAVRASSGEKVTIERNGGKGKSGGEGVKIYGNVTFVVPQGVTTARGLFQSLRETAAA